MLDLGRLSTTLSLPVLLINEEAGGGSTVSPARSSNEMASPCSSSLLHQPPQSQQTTRREEYGLDELVVNCRDACIYGRDLLLLEEPTKTAWLNDACLHFALQRLMQQVEEEAEHRTSSTPRDVLCLDPSVLSFLMHQCDDKDDLLDFGQGYNHFAGVHRVYLPINDNLTNRNWHIPGGGTHWSLLLVVASSMMDEHHQPPRREDGEANDDQQSPENDGSAVEPRNNTDGEECLRFYHFDSVSGHNSEVARSVAAQWYKVWSLAKNQKRLDSTTALQHPPPQPGPPVKPSSPPVAIVHDCRAPQQRNGCDCGLHVLGTTEALLHGGGGPGTRDCDEDHNDVETLESRVERYFHGDSSAVCAQLRDRIAQDIRALAAASG